MRSPSLLVALGICAAATATTTPDQSTDDVLALLTSLSDASHSIADFRNELQGRFADGFLGMHATGHFSVGGEASDLYLSPSDPSFFLHHAMVDRIYWIWQVLHPFQATDIAAGNHMITPTAQTQKINALNLGVNAANIKVEDALNTLDCPFCYIYL